MSDAGEGNKQRNREIARNEATRQTVGDVRVSAWAIAIAILDSVTVSMSDEMIGIFRWRPSARWASNWVSCGSTSE